MQELIRVRVQYAARQQCSKTHKRPLPVPFTGMILFVNLLVIIKNNINVCFNTNTTGIFNSACCQTVRIYFFTKKKTWYTHTSIGVEILSQFFPPCSELLSHSHTRTSCDSDGRQVVIVRQVTGTHVDSACTAA